VFTLALNALAVNAKVNANWRFDGSRMPQQSSSAIEWGQ
jgi:hypothetical protein